MQVTGEKMAEQLVALFCSPLVIPVVFRVCPLAPGRDILSTSQGHLTQPRVFEIQVETRSLIFAEVSNFRKPY